MQLTQLNKDLYLIHFYNCNYLSGKVHFIYIQLSWNVGNLQYFSVCITKHNGYLIYILLDEKKCIFNNTEGGHGRMLKMNLNGHV